MVKHEVLSPQQLEQPWADHLKGEFESKDVEATLVTMVEDASVNHMPVNTRRGKGKDALRRFYRERIAPSGPPKRVGVAANLSAGRFRAI